MEGLSSLDVIAEENSALTADSIYLLTSLCQYLPVENFWKSTLKYIYTIVSFNFSNVFRKLKQSVTREYILTISWYSKEFARSRDVVMTKKQSERNK
mgnify:FL=1